MSTSDGSAAMTLHESELRQLRERLAEAKNGALAAVRIAENAGAPQRLIRDINRLCALAETVQARAAKPMRTQP